MPSPDISSDKFLIIVRYPLVLPPVFTPPSYCDGAQWYDGALMLISQFMGRLAMVNRTHMTDMTDRKTDRDTHTTLAIFSSVQLVSDAHFQEVFNVSGFRTRLFTSLSSSNPVRATIAC
jgi:hypothetical protein